MPVLDDLALAAAIKQVTEGEPLRKVARQYHIPRSTLRRRIDGVSSKETAHSHRQSLSPTLEKGLVDWILTQARLGWAPPYSRFHWFAQRLFINSGQTGVIGKHWHTKFLKRWPQLKTMASTPLDFKRANGASIENIAEFFDRLDQGDAGIVPLEHTYNADEVGAYIGWADNYIVFGPAELEKIYAMEPANREWTTTLECVSADGRALPPTIIFAGASIQQQWFGDLQLGEEYADWMFTSSPNGWTSKAIALQWLEELFLPLTRPEDPCQWRHLILDGHNSHTDDRFMLCCLENKVWLDFLPAHCSQVLQPLDLGPFSVLKRKYRDHLRSACRRSLTMTPKKPEFLEAWMAARRDAFKPSIIDSGWRATGIFPRDRSKPLNSRLARQHTRDRPESDLWRAATPPEDPGLAVMTGLDIATPRSSRHINVIARELRSMDPAYRSPTFKTFQKKLGKALDEATVQISELREQRDQYAVALERQRSQKRRKVKETAQQGFIRVADVRRVKEELATSSNAKGKRKARKRVILELESSDEVESEAEEEIRIS